MHAYDTYNAGMYETVFDWTIYDVLVIDYKPELNELKSLPSLIWNFNLVTKNNELIMPSFSKN